MCQKSKKLNWLKISVFAAVSVSVSAFSLNAQTGRSAYEFLTIPSSSHVYGLGGTNITIIDEDVNLAEQNPALIGPEMGRQLSFGYMHYMGNANFAGARYGSGVGEHGAWAAGIRYLNYGKLEGYESDGTYTGSFTTSDIVFEATYSHDFTYRLRGGINIKMAYSNYERYTAFALAADLGINYYDDENDLSLSAVLKNMGGQLKRFEEKYDHLPFDIQLGVMKGIGSSFSFCVTALHLSHWNLPYYTHDKETGTSVLKSNFFSNLMRHLILGVQYEPNERVYIDLAYNYKTMTDMSVYQRNFLSGFSVGVGFRTNKFSLGAAYAMPHKGTSTILVNIGLDLWELL